MDNTINNVQINTKTFLRIITMIFAIAITLIIPTSSSNSYAEPPRGGADCETLDVTYGQETLQCCWTETDPSDPEQIEIYKCQMCDIIDGNRVNCSPPYPDPTPAPPTTKENIAPEIEDGIEQPPSENTPPIRSDNSVAPNDDGNFLDEQQPNSPQFNQRVPPGNAGGLEQLEDSSNNQNSESGDSISSNNPGFSNVEP